MERAESSPLSVPALPEDDFFGDLTPIVEDDLAAFVPVSEIGVSKTVIREIGERDTIAETRQWLRKLNADAGDVPPDFAMNRVLERWADGSREGQKMGVLALVRLDERGHRGLAAALDQLWQVRAKDPRDFRRLTEWARARVLVNPTPAGDRGCTCDLSLSVRNHVRREPQDEEEDGEEGYTSTWVPRDLDALWDDSEGRKIPTILYRTDKCAMFYCGETHSVHGESESGKSWIAQVAVVDVLRTGGRVLYLDYESDERSILGRLRALQIEREWLARCHYVAPDGPRDVAFLALLSGEYDLCVIDGVTAALSAEPNAKSADGDFITAWDKALPRRIARATGAAVVMVDHVTKSSDSRGRFAIGSQQKMANVSGSAFYVDVEAVLRIGQIGVLRIYVAKDRPSGVREHAGPMRKDRMQPFARLVFDGRHPAIETDLVPWIGQDEDVEPDLTRDAYAGPPWWERATSELPEDAQKLAGDGASVARDIWRLLDHLADPDGRTLAQIKSMLDERRTRAGSKPVSRTSFYAAVAKLKNAELVERDGERLTVVSAT
jgi:hypothetical protein